MNRIAALVISTILLTQIASYSYGDIPSQIEWEEPLKGDPDWKVTGRNSTGNQTGNNTTTPQITIEMGQSWYQSSSTATAYINSTDLTINKQYRVDWELEQQSPTTSIVDDGNFTWTATSTTDHRVVYFTPPNGSYWAVAWLSEVVNSTSQSWLDTDATNFTVGNNSTSTGGNNSGGNSSTNGCGNGTHGRLSDNWNFTEVQEDTLFDYVIHADCLFGNGAEYEIVYQIWQSNGTSPWHSPTTWQAQLISYNETWVLNVSGLNPGTVGGGHWVFVTKLHYIVDTGYSNQIDQITHDYCVNSDTFSCNGSVGNNSGGNTGINNSNGHIFIESIWTNWSSSDSHAMGEVQDIDGEWTAYWGVYNGEYSFEDFGNLYLWDNSTGWWQVPAGSGGVSGGIGTLNSSGDMYYQVHNLNEWAAHPVDLCGTFVIALFEGNLGDATGQTTPATTYPISYDSMVFGPEDCGSNHTTDHSIEMYNYPQYVDCVFDSLTINATLYDPHNVSGGETNLTIVINQYIYDSNGDLDDDLSSQAVMVVSTNISFDMDGFGFINEEISTATLSDGEYGYAIFVGNMTFLYVGYSFEVGCSGCGYNSSLITSNYEIWSYTFGTLFSNWNPWNQSTNGSNSVNDDTPQIYQGDTLSASVWFSCMVYGEDYLANLTVTNDANLIVFSEEESITQDTYSTWYSFYEDGISTDQLPAGEYCLTFTLYVSPFGSSDVVYTVTECVEIVSLDDWDGCGTNLTYLQHLQDVNGNPFVQQGTVFLTTSEIWYNNFVDCLVIGENYTMVTTVTHDGSQYMQETDNFTVNQFSDVTQWSWVTISSWNSDAPVGNYCVETTIHSTDSTYTNMIALVSTVTDCFAVVEITPTDWWGGQTNNSTGSPNNPIMPDTNCTNLSSSLSGLNLTNAFNLSDCENGTGFWFNLTVNGTGVNWYDPVYAVGYDFEVLSGPKFASVVVPPGYGDDKYDIYLWDGSEYVLAASGLDALTQYWFTDDGQVTTTPGDYDGITTFSIRGLELDAKLDPDDPNAFVTGLTFVQDPNEVSEVVLSMNPIRVSDEDDDGIADAYDNCVDDANADQADSDGDGIGDVCDTATSGTGEGGDGDDKPDSGSDSNRTLAYAALLAVALVGILVMFGREDDR